MVPPPVVWCFPLPVVRCGSGLGLLEVVASPCDVVSVWVGHVTPACLGKEVTGIWCVWSRAGGWGIAWGGGGVGEPRTGITHTHTHIYIYIYILYVYIYIYILYIYIYICLLIFG